MPEKELFVHYGKRKAVLDELLNARVAEGWELVTYDYMATSSQIKGAFIITFRKAI